MKRLQVVSSSFNFFLFDYIFLISCINFFTVTDHFSECVESHAFETYDKFIKAKGGIILIFILLPYCQSMFHIQAPNNMCISAVCCKDELKKQAPSKVAVKYYTQGDMYLFGKSNF